MEAGGLDITKSFSLQFEDSWGYMRVIGGGRGREKGEGRMMGEGWMEGDKERERGGGREIEREYI